MVKLKNGLFSPMSRGTQGGVMRQQISLEIENFVNVLFKFESVTRSTWAHKKFITEMLTGILGSRSILIANISRFLNESIPLISTEQRLCTMLRSTPLAVGGFET